MDCSGGSGRRNWHGRAALRISQRGGGTLRIEELTDDFEPGERLLTGKGTCTGQAHLTGPALVHLHSTGDWHITLAPGRT
ncbi:hypothetical protein ACWDYJ_27240 [Streptomyces sp. NPDC003042]